MDVSLQSNNSYNSYLDINNYKVQNIEPSNPVENTNKTIDSNEDNSTPRKFTQLPKEELVALYYNQQATQLTKDVIDIYTQASEETDYTSNSVEISFKDINELSKQLNKISVLENIASTPKEERDVGIGEALENIKENKPEVEISKEEAIALYYNYQANQLTKDIIDIYANNSQSDDSNDSVGVSFQDISELSNQVNKNIILENVSSVPKNERDIGNGDALEDIKENKPELNVSKEEVISTYYNHKANELTEDLIDIYTKNS